MKIVNVMNFVRQCEPRWADVDAELFPTTKAQLEMVKEMGVDHTFLLQYDTLCDPKYIDLFKNEATEQTELGLWYEIVEELTDAVGIPYKSECGWKWDWHIIPGFSMGYSVEEREKLIDEAMRKFKEVYGYYPKTVGSWMMDTHTINYLADHYEISTMCNCRDQINTDAYTMIGGYFNQAYYPSRKNMFTPAQSEELRVNVPMFRLLGPDPIHCYDQQKYVSEECKLKTTCYTMEAALVGPHPSIMDWFLKTYYENEDMGFSYSQIGQENSFAGMHLVRFIRSQIERVKQMPDVKFMKMSDTGKWFKDTYGTETPSTSVVATDNWDREDVQSVYYDSQYYTANLFRHNSDIFFRAIYAFDEQAEDTYLKDKYTTYYAVYENQPIVDTVVWDKDVDQCGMYFDCGGNNLLTERKGESQLEVSWGENSVLFDKQSIKVKNTCITFYPGKPTAEIKVEDNAIKYFYREREYALQVIGGKVSDQDGRISIVPFDNEMELRVVTKN